MKSRSIRLWRLLALAALLLVQLAAGGGAIEVSHDDHEASDLDTNRHDADADEEPAQLWQPSSGGGSWGGIITRMLLATSGSSKPKPPAPRKCYKSNCDKNDTNIAVCKQQARDAKSPSIQCCKQNRLAPLRAPFIIGSGCVDLSSRFDYCGTCTTFCAEGQICCRGACVNTCCDGACPAGLTCCNNRCVNLQSDKASCGACGAACPADPPGAWACCGSRCVNVMDHDELNCGQCNNFCLDVCCAGVCKLSNSDPDFCGSCDPVRGKCPPDKRICCDAVCINSTVGLPPCPAG